MSLKNNILASTTRQQADANLQIALAHPHISPKNRRRCWTAFRSVIARLPEEPVIVIDVNPVSKTTAKVVKPRATKSKAKAPAKPRARKVAKVAGLVTA